MPFETLFAASSLFVMPFWLLMMALPHWRVTRRVIASPAIVLPAALLYAALIVPQLGTAAPILTNPTLAAVSDLLASPAGATVGWVHFLAFDLFVGRWTYLDSRERNVSAWVMAPVLFLILMVGPLGLVLYLALRRFAGRQA